MNKLKLFAFPYAGASATAYYKWKKHLSDEIDFKPIELAGRGFRSRDSLYRTFDEAVHDVYEQVEGLIDDGPYAFFGHSMGSQLSFELAYMLRAHGRPEPSVMFLSGRWAPHILRPDLVNPSTPHEQLIERLMELGGTPPELFENPALANTFIPILKADFYAMESYVYQGGRELLTAAFNVMTGVQDWDVNKRDLAEWGQHTTGPFSLHKFKGGHFYINDSFEAVIQHINRSLLSTVQ
ncbi:thioesterase domain-containing protein [Paenibacillus pasadenensis]|uniref:thioesterase II family protein n=1 Tax=Paenibacillus pasadenensis TaxID=217090 RepID=UPI00203FA0B3|nr:thioesterase domain-containing protein [Paenibacillus pasadenensis]MCM3746405.1 thioesterase domain-containing protein [Paenibacillus pasadenensis]